MKQPMDKKKESKGPVSDKKPMDLLLLGLGIPVPGVGPTLEIKRNNKTIADWVNGHAKMKTRVPTVENEASASDGVPLSGSHTPSEHITKKLICVQPREQRGV